MWVANFGDGTVNKFRVSDFKLLGTFSLPSTLGMVAFDGANIWVCIHGSNRVAKM
jgi:hypothetical protein